MGGTLSLSKTLGRWRHERCGHSPVARAAGMSAPVPVVTLRIEQQMSNPPKPVGFVVVHEGKVIGVLEPKGVLDAVQLYNMGLERFYKGQVLW